MEEILENERKNSKNEINAKLNNQENYENAVIETKKSNSDEKSTQDQEDRLEGLWIRK